VKIVLTLAVLGLLAGCGFMQGVRDGAMREGMQTGADYVAGKLSDDYKELKDVVVGLPGKIPQPQTPDDTKNTLLYAIGALIGSTIVAGSKGLIRAQGAKKSGSA
jgi:hypothetical protein